MVARIVNLSRFNSGLAKFARETPARFRVVRDKLVMDGLRSLIVKTPVLTGRAKNNWFVTVGAPSEDVVMKGEFDKTGANAVTAGGVIVATAPTFTVTYISNNLPYIFGLDQGASKQQPTPGGILDATFDELRSQFS